MKKLILITTLALACIVSKAQSDINKLSVQAGVTESSTITHFYFSDYYSDAWDNSYRAVTPNGWKPAAVVSFRYEFTKHLEFGMNLSGFSQNVKYKRNLYDQNSNDDITIRKSFYSLTVTANYVYFNTDFVKMYVGGAAGMCEYTEYEEGDMQTRIVGQVTCLGLRVGKRIYGYAEVGAGCLGFVSGGIGYHFGK